jgi:hypothetical protein
MAWDDWVKEYAKCVHCGKIGHIRPHCPKYLAQIESGEIQRPPRTPKRNLQRGACKLNGPKYKGGDRKAQALLSAFNAIYGQDSSSDSDHKDDGGDDHEQDNVTNEDESNSHIDEDRQTFLSMIGSSLKD